MGVIDFNSWLVKFFEITIPYYIQIPFYLRTGLVLFAIILLFYFISTRTFPVLLKKVLNAFLLLLALIFYLITIPLNILFKIIGKDKANTNWLVKLENTFLLPGELINKLNSNVSKENIERSTFTNYLRKCLYLFPIIAIGVVYYFPYTAYVQKWEAAENGFIRYALNITYDNLVLEDKYFALKDNVRAANIRAKPGQENGIITTVKNGQSLYYLHDSGQDKNGDTWHKVKTENGKVGWIHGNLVK